MSVSSSGSVLVRPMIGMKFWSPGQRGTTCWCRCAAMPAPAICALVHPDVEAAGARDRADGASPAGQVGDLGGLLVGGLGVVGEVAVGADHQVARRVGVEVEHREGELAAVHDEARRRRRGSGSGRTGTPPTSRRRACSRRGCRPSGAASRAGRGRRARRCRPGWSGCRSRSAARRRVGRTTRRSGRSGSISRPSRRAWPSRRCQTDSVSSSHRLAGRRLARLASDPAATAPSTAPTSP